MPPKQSMGPQSPAAYRFMTLRELSVAAGQEKELTAIVAVVATDDGLETMAQKIREQFRAMLVKDD